MPKPVVALRNASTCVSDAQIEALLPALQTQVTCQFSPAWDLPGADLAFMADRNAPLPEGAWVLAILDDSDQADALGYHDVTSDGQPMGKVFARTDLEYGENWTTTVSHELLELLGDPTCQNLVAATFRGKQVLTFREACDAVEAQSYDVDGQSVSNFVLPSFFSGSGGRFDFLGQLASPMTIAPGGYLAICADGDWTQVFGERVPLHKRRLAKGSRRERFLLRMNHHRKWQHSTAI